MLFIIYQMNVMKILKETWNKVPGKGDLHTRHILQYI